MIPTQAVFPHNLPIQATPFVGRSSELADLARLLDDPTCRLLTLVGPGGIGKTRLALEAAARRGEFADGIYFAALQPLNSPEFLLSTTAEAVKFQFYAGGDPKKQLLDYLAPKNLLLILDNFEHLLDGVALISEMLAAAPKLRMMVTSRETLNLQEEWLYPVKGLHFPEGEQAGDMESYDAIQLFMESARRVRPDFSLASDQAAVVRICTLVEGMPLALEMAAAWLKRLSCREIAHEIARSLDILESPARNAPARHHNMRAVFDHSWNLLNDTEREVFKKLSVFRGGFRKEAAQAVAGASLSTLAALVDKSFLRVDGTGRYDLHELLRQYGEEKLRLDADEYHAARDQHSAYHAEFMRQQEPKLKSHQQQIALKEIEAEIDNVRAAWEWALEQRQLEDIDKSCECLRYYFEVRGWYHEGEAFFRHAAERLTPDDASENQNLTFGKVLLGQANCAYRSGYYGKALERLQDCLAIFRQYVSQRETALALAFIIGVMPKNRREQAQLYQECLSICRAVNDPWLTCYVAIQAGQGSAGGDLFVTDFQRDIKIAYDDLVLVKQFGDRWLIMRSLRRTGLIAIRMGAYDEARRLFLEAVAICEYLNSPYMKAQMVHWLGTISQNLGEYDDAKRLYQASLLVGRIAQNYWLLWINTTGLSDIARMQGRYAEAKQLALEAIEYLQVAGEASFLDGKVWALSSLGAAELALKDYLQARQHFAEALQISINVWSIPLTLQSLAFIAELLAAEGNLEPALDLLVITLHHILSRKETQDKTAQCLAQYEAHWSPETITGVREGWRAKEIQVDSLAEILSVSAESVSEWLTGLKPPISPPPSKLQRSSQLFTERELEILRLVAEGHSNREIAQQHVLALSTVKWYVKQLYNKLGVNNRTQAAARARELHLL